jgi:hypothetical protein
VFFEFHPCHLLIKGTPTRIPLLQGRCIRGLYPLHHSGDTSSPEALLVVRPSPTLWHQWLGHPRSFSLQQVLSQNKLLVAPSNNNASVCNACQMSKSHQLPFYDSNNYSSSPLPLVHTDVWGLAIRSSSGYRYYVSFIDDFSRFSWIYVIKHKSDVHHIFL